MGKHYQGRGGGGRGRGGSRASTNQKGSTGDSASAANYRAPTAGYEDQVFLHGTMKAAAIFTAVLTKLARIVSLHSWAGATIAGRAMKNLEEPTLIEPQAPTMVYTKTDEYFFLGYSLQRYQNEYCRIPTLSHGKAVK